MHSQLASSQIYGCLQVKGRQKSQTLLPTLCFAHEEVPNIQKPKKSTIHSLIKLHDKYYDIVSHVCIVVANVLDKYFPLHTV